MIPPLVLAADTIVVSGQSIQEKPADEADAFHMLSRLRTRTGRDGRGPLAHAEVPPQDRFYQGHFPARVR